MSLLIKGSFSNAPPALGDQPDNNWCWIKHRIFVFEPSQLPANNHSLHRYLSVLTVGHPSHGADLLVGPSAGER